VAVSIVSFAQVTKADVQKMMSEINVSLDKFETLNVYNTQVFYVDGTYTKSYTTYKKSNGEFSNSILIYDTGIVMASKKNGVAFSRYMYPYESISYIEMTQTGLWIYLK
jgi:hypothetical protein